MPIFIVNQKQYGLTVRLCTSTQIFKVKSLKKRYFLPRLKACSSQQPEELGKHTVAEYFLSLQSEKFVLIYYNVTFSNNRASAQLNKINLKKDKMKNAKPLLE